MAEVNKTEAGTAKKTEVKKTFVFKCIDKCFWHNELFRTGDIVKLDSDKDIPPQFVAMNK